MRPLHLPHPTHLGPDSHVHVWQVLLLLHVWQWGGECISVTLWTRKTRDLPLSVGAWVCQDLATVWLL